MPKLEFPISPEIVHWQEDTEVPALHWGGILLAQGGIWQPLLDFVLSSSILGVGTPEDGEPGIKVFSSSAWAQRGPPQGQARPEENGDHLYQPQDDARETRVPFWMPVPEVQNGPEEDRDHLYHPQDNAREVNARVAFRMMAPKVQNGPEEDLDYIHHG
uniref:Uncharacterized protein n=1 Tax=Junco hyemalis TaxID=40217 RepID=A0A8C5JJZ1_JUNHY